MPLVNVSQVYARQGKIGMAESSLRKALAIEPEHTAVNFNLGLLVGGKGDVAGAEGFLLAATKSSPDMAIAFFNLGIVQRQLGRKDALVPLQKAIDLEPDNPKFVQGLASFILEDGNRAKALFVLDKYLEKNPGQMQILQMACQVLGQQEDWAGIRKRMRTALDTGTLHPQARAALEQQLKQLDQR